MFVRPPFEPSYHVGLRNFAIAISFDVKNGRFSRLVAPSSSDIFNSLIVVPEIPVHPAINRVQPVEPFVDLPEVLSESHSALNAMVLVFQGWSSPGSG